MLSAVAVGDWLLLRNRMVAHPTWILALLVGAVLVLLAFQFARAAADLLRGLGSRPLAAARLLTVAGAGLALAAGMANWLFSLQGFAILHEGEAVPLHGGSHLQHLEGGPLSRIEEMDLALALAEVEIMPGVGGAFFPRSLLEVKSKGGEPVRLSVDPSSNAAHGSLRFHQGTFGFAPRIVIQRDEKVIFDRTVPFTTERRRPGIVSFREIFRISSERLRVEGSVDLASLDEGMRGHATLRLEIYEDAALVGQGALLPGHFADIEGGYRVGFVGLAKWSEIDISRRNYGRFVLLGVLLVAVGAVAWLMARWRAR